MEKTLLNRKENYANIHNELEVYVEKIYEDKERINKTIQMLENYIKKSDNTFEKLLTKIEISKKDAHLNKLNHELNECRYYNNRFEMVKQYNKVIDDNNKIAEIGLRYGLLDTILREVILKINNKRDEIIDQLNINESYELIINSLKEDKVELINRVKDLALSPEQKDELKKLKINNNERLSIYQGFFKDTMFGDNIKDCKDNDIFLDFDVFKVIDYLSEKKDINDEIQNTK